MEYNCLRPIRFESGPEPQFSSIVNGRKQTLQKPLHFVTTKTPQLTTRNCRQRDSIKKSLKYPLLCHYKTCFNNQMNRLLTLLDSRIRPRV